MAQTELEQLLFTMDANITRLSKKMDDANGKVDKATRRMERRVQAASKELERQFARGFDRVGAAATVAFMGLSAYAVKVASDARELQATFEIAFDGGVERAEEFAQVLADKVGRSVTDIKSGMTDLKLVLNGLGVEGAQGLKMVELLSGRGLDIAAQRNVTDAEAMRAIISAITGETEPMKRFGAVINETAVKAELLRLGFKGNAQEASEAAKAVARANLILARTSDAMGTAERESGELANQVKRAQGEFKEAARALGDQLLPAATSATKATTDLIQKFAELPSGVQLAALALIGLAAASGPIMTTVKALQALIVTAGGARVALAGLMGTGVAGAVGATAGTVGLVGGGLYLAARDGSRADKFNAVRNNLGEATGDDLAWAQEYVGSQRKRFKYGAPEGVDVNRLHAEYDEFDKVIAGELSRRQKALEDATKKKIKQESDEAAKQALAGIQLTEGQSAGSGKAGGKKSNSDAAAAKRREEMQKDLALEEKLLLAQEKKDTKRIQEIEDEIRLLQLRRQYEGAGLSDKEVDERASGRLAIEQRMRDSAEAREAIEAKIAKGIQDSGESVERFARERERIADIERDRLKHQIDLARLRGDEKAIKAAERELQVRERIDDLTRRGDDDPVGNANREANERDLATRQGQYRDMFANAFSEGVRAAASGDLESFISNMVGSATERALKNLGGKLFDMSGLGGVLDGILGPDEADPIEAGIINGGAIAGTEIASAMTTAGAAVAAMLASASTANAVSNTSAEIASFLDGASSGGRATGGRVSAGSLYRVNDGGGPKEFFAPDVSGVMMTAAQVNHTAQAGLAALARQGGGGQPVNQTLNLDARGAVMTEDLMARMQAMAMRAQTKAVDLSRRQLSGNLNRLNKIGTV